MTEYQREKLSCADCIHFSACARWNAGEATEMEMCEYFKPMCENCYYGESTPSSKYVRCLRTGVKEPRNYYCKTGTSR